MASSDGKRPASVENVKQAISDYAGNNAMQFFNVADRTVTVNNPFGYCNWCKVSFCVSSGTTYHGTYEGEPSGTHAVNCPAASGSGSLSINIIFTDNGKSGIEKAVSIAFGRQAYQIEGYFCSKNLIE